MIQDTLKTEAQKEIERVETESPEKNAFAEFSTSDGNIQLRIRDMEDEIELSKLGTANNVLSRVLNLSSDTHKGATVKEYKYEDLHLQFFAPKDSDDFWLMNVTITGGPWFTARGIKAGDSLQDLKTMYPKATNEFSGNKDIYRYELDDSAIEFGITNEKVTRIELRYNIP